MTIMPFLCFFEHLLLTPAQQSLHSSPAGWQMTLHCDTGVSKAQLSKMVCTHCKTCMFVADAQWSKPAQLLRLVGQDYMCD